MSHVTGFSIVGFIPRLKPWAFSVNFCKYHFVWCPKYRHPILGLVQDEVTELFTVTADHFGHKILALEIADDHVHLFVQTDPKHSPSDTARQFKSYSGKHILKQRPEIRESYFWGGGFWKVGYYVGTTGAVSKEVVQRYIEQTKH